MFSLPTARRAWRTAALAATLASAAVPGAAQTPGAALGKLGEQSLGVREGLPAEQVLGFHQDRSGGMWIGTVEGLARLSGPQVRVYDVKDGLPRKVVYAVAEDEEGALFAGTVNGVARYDPQEDRFRDAGLAAAGRVRALLPGPGGRDLFALFLPSRLYRRRSGAWTEAPLAGLPGGATANGIAFGEGGRLFLATRDHGLLAFDPEADGFRLAARWDRAPFFPGGLAYSVISGPGFAAATSREGLVWIDRAGARRLPFPGGPSQRPLATGPDGTVYAGSDAGLFRLRGESLEPLVGVRSLTDVNPVALQVDSGGDVWCGTLARGALVMRTGVPVLHYLGPGGVPGDQVQQVAPLGPGRAWVITDRGGFELRYDPEGHGQGLVPLGGPALPRLAGAEWLLRLTPDAGLLGTTAGVLRTAGLVEPSRRRFEWDPRFESLRGIYVPALERGAREEVWVGSASGLFVLEPGAPLRQVGVGAPDDRIRAVAPLPTGQTVVLTSSGEVFWVPVERAGAPSRVDLPAQGEEVKLGPDGRAWVSLDDGSTRVLEADAGGAPRVAVSLTADGPLGGLSVRSLTPLPDGGWLVAHAAGVGRLDPRSLTETERWLSPNELDGVRTRRVETIADEDGGIWLWTLRGLARFRPRGFHPPPIPRLSLERLKLDGRGLPAAPAGPIPLAPSHSLELGLALPEPTAPGSVRFRYRLGGEGETWSPWSPSGQIRLRNLPPGRVRLDLEGRDRLGRPSGPVTLWLDVATPWWRGPWALGSWALLLALTVARVVRLRGRRLVRRQAELERAVSQGTRGLAEANARLAASIAALKELDQIKTEFLGIAAHDLKNPLAVVLGLSELLLDQAQKADAGSPRFAPEMEERARFIRDCATQMAAIVGHLLQTAALDSGDVRLDRRLVDLGELVKRVAETLGTSAAQKRITVSVAANGDTRALVDEGRLREVLDNLLGNAIKFSPPGRSVFVTAEPAPEAPAERVRVTVRDEGPGLTAGDRERLFGRFQRLSARPTGGETSTGLGLFIAKRLVELHGGRVWAEGELGTGTSFVLELPREARRAPGRAAVRLEPGRPE